MELSRQLDMSRSEFLWFCCLIGSFLLGIALVALHLFVPDLAFADARGGVEFSATSILTLALNAGGLFLLSRV